MASTAWAVHDLIRYNDHPGPRLVPILGLLTTLLIVGIIHWFGNVWKIILFRQALRWRLILLFSATGVPANILASWLVPQHMRYADLWTYAQQVSR